MQQNIFTITIIIVLFCCINFCFASVNLDFNRITLEDGLTGNRYNNFIFQDSRGFVWISSFDGLNRFDGKQIKRYRAKSGMLSNNIQSNFFEDSKGNIWFTTYEAINCLHPKNDQIKNFKLNNENSDYKAFYLDTNHKHLWLRAGNSIYKWNIEHKSKKIILKEIPSTTKAFKVATDKNGKLNHIAIAIGNDQVWFLFPDGDPNKKIHTFPNFVDLVYLKNNKWLVYTKDQTTFLFDADNTDSVQKVRTDQIENVVEAIKYNDENHFITTESNGLWLYNWKTGKYSNHWTHQPTNQYSILSNNPQNLYRSSSTNYLWMSHSNKGLNYSKINLNSLQNPLKKLTKEEIDVRAITQTKSGYIYVTTRLNGVYVYAKDGTHLHHFDFDFDSSGLKSTIEIDSQSCLTNSGKAIYLLDLSTDTFSELSFNIPTPSFRFLVKIFPNRQLVTTSKGILELKKHSKDNWQLQDIPEFSAHQEFRFQQIFQTSDNILIIPYNDNMLWIYQANRDGLVELNKSNTYNLQFFGFCESRENKGSIWVGTSKGLYKIDSLYSLSPVNLDNSELSNGNVYGIAEDNNGILWLSTNNGIWKYNPNDSIKPTHFESIDGLSGEQFSLYNSALHASNGTVWFGNNKGIVKFYPDSIKVHKEVPNLHLDDLIVNDTKSFKKNIEDSKLVLKHDQNTLTFDIKAINLYKTKRNKIHYQLAGYDEDSDTLQVNNGEKIRYTKIKPGNYALNAYAEDANGHKSKMKELLSLEINPPLWKTWPFLFLYALLTALITYSLLKWRENYIIKEQAKKTAIAKLETQVLDVEMKALKAQMNPHFLFNSLNSIKSLILKTKEKEASEYLSKFSTLLRSILNNSEKQKIRLNEEIEALKLYTDLEALRFASDFNYQIQMDKTIDSSFIRIPPLLLQPFVENAIWHGLLPKTSGNPKLNINIIRKEDFLFFEIEDNGVGRKKAATLPKQENEKSMGIDITKRRIQLLHEENDIEIIDLVDHQQKALGTKVVIKLYAPE